MKSLGLLAIRFYQRYISPYKGFRCAYGAYTGCASCSALGYRAVQRYGVWNGVPLIRQRFRKCNIAHHRLLAIRNINKNISAISRLQTTAPLYSLKLQAGDCDIGGCDFIDISDIDFCDVADLFADCSSCGSDNDNSKKKSINPHISNSDYIPPQRQ